MRLQEIADYRATSSSGENLKSLREIALNPSGKWSWIRDRMRTSKTEAARPLAPPETEREAME